MEDFLTGIGFAYALALLARVIRQAPQQKKNHHFMFAENDLRGTPFVQCYLGFEMDIQLTLPMALSNSTNCHRFAAAQAGLFWLAPV